ncbi:MAG: 3-phosphoserine/phosphohydroxythreonine transaminase [Clostridia bacterium]|nr:3-phosphoserine/phosphohydroxythreonine transaminase [Clostridia bacterium]
MNRVYNFSAGPSTLPEKVLEITASELMNYNGSGMSVMEMSHRSSVYETIIQDCESTLRRLMQIPDNYKVLFLQGGASTQFAAIPLNLLSKNGKADYVVTGQFSKKAYSEAKKYGDIRLVASSEDKNNTYIPRLTKEDFRPDADYVHICFNNTIFGTKWDYIPETPAPLVADMSSCILSEPVDVTKFGMIYAGAQKNMAPAGLTIVIIREDLLGNALPICPTMLDYKVMADNGSMYNTPPCWCIYVAGLVAKWVEEDMGGLEGMKAYNQEKAAILYDYLDSQDYYKNPNEKTARSMMNVTFVTGDKDLDAKFAKEAAAAGFVNLKGHRSVGGMRASIYNAMPKEGVLALVEFMKQFSQANPKG